MPQRDREPGQAAGPSVRMVEERQRQKKQQRRELLTGVAIQQLDAILTARCHFNRQLCKARQTSSRDGIKKMVLFSLATHCAVLWPWSPVPERLCPGQPCG